MLNNVMLVGKVFDIDLEYGLLTLKLEDKSKKEEIYIYTLINDTIRKSINEMPTSLIDCVVGIKGRLINSHDNMMVEVQKLTYLTTSKK